MHYQLLKGAGSAGGNGIGPGLCQPHGPAVWEDPAATPSAIGRLLPALRQGDRKVANASTRHCTVLAVLGHGAGRRFHAESYLEYGHLLQLSADPEVRRLDEQVLFQFGPKASSHYFDVVATMTSGARIAYTVKPEFELRAGAFLTHMQNVARHVRRTQFASEVRLLTEADLDPVALHNAKLFTGLRDADPVADATARACAADLVGALPLLDLTRRTGLEARGYRALLRLLRSGELSLARRERITPASIVHKKDLLH
ncbi:hypothetical protein ORIO_04495 [Cereibacter azotoformans]|uniref:hypothetical protein n=1 Tax=Cereibacter azotoformans TaxID=43057 RepID=UPI001EECF35A|nr:hypothetical protein [Cereibacter azotoformans]ULB09184.1 hypothetical protein ORIO_04495 [Cereibacter azotoformans]